MSEFTRAAAGEIISIMESYGFEAPVWNEPWDLAMPKLAAFMKWADEELKNEEFVVGAEVQLQEGELKDESDEFIGYKYSRQSIAAPLTDELIRALSVGDRLGLGAAIFMTRAQGQGGRVTVFAEEGRIYADIKPLAGKLTQGFKAYEQRALGRLGWRKADFDDGWILELPKQSIDPLEESVHVEKQTEAVDRADPGAVQGQGTAGEA